MEGKLVGKLARKVGFTVYVYLVLPHLVLLWASAHLVVRHRLLDVALHDAFHACGLLVGPVVVVLLVRVLAGLVVENGPQHEWL